MRRHDGGLGDPDETGVRIAIKDLCRLSEERLDTGGDAWWLLAKLKRICGTFYTRLADEKYND